MSKQVFIETSVGLFVILGILALLVLGLKMSNLGEMLEQNTYPVTAQFENIGSLKVRAPISISGVRIGEVSNIKLDPKTFEAIVTLQINSKYREIIADNITAKIQTAGLLGANYIALLPGYANSDTEKPMYLHSGSQITNTQSALILEDMIGQLLYSSKNKSEGHS